MDSSMEKLAAMRQLWSLYRLIFDRKGLDIAAKWARWSEQKRHTLNQYESGKSFDDLCKGGCKELPLAALVAVIEPLKAFEKRWTETTGSKRERKRKISKIENAVSVFHDLLVSLPDLSLTDKRKSSIIDSLKDLEVELIVFHPAIIIHALTAYMSILEMFEAAQTTTGVDSSEMLGKYLFSAYVYRATSRPHDKEVSDLIGAALGIT
jgi:hypothetical protein